MVMFWIIVLALGAVAAHALLGRTRRAAKPGAWVGVAALVILSLWLADVASAPLLRPPSPVIDVPSDSLQPPVLIGDGAGAGGQGGWVRVGPD